MQATGQLGLDSAEGLLQFFSRLGFLLALGDAALLVLSGGVFGSTSLMILFMVVAIAGGIGRRMIRNRRS